MSTFIEVFTSIYLKKCAEAQECFFFFFCGKYYKVTTIIFSLFYDSSVCEYIINIVK